MAVVNKFIAKNFDGSVSEYDIGAQAENITMSDGSTVEELLSQATNDTATLYGVCNAARDTKAKTVDIDGFTLANGATVIVKFTNGLAGYNSAGSAASLTTLNVNGTGAKTIGVNAIDSLSSMNLDLGSGVVLTLVYDAESDMYVMAHGYAMIAEYASNVDSIVAEITPEIQTVTLTNSADYPLNDSAVQVGLGTTRNTVNYMVEVIPDADAANVGEIEVYNKAVNGFYIRFNGSASSVDATVKIRGGMLA